MELISDVQNTITRLCNNLKFLKKNWKNAITEDFLSNWVQKERSDDELSEDTISDFETIFKGISIPQNISLRLLQNSTLNQANRLKKKKNSVKLAIKNSKILDVKNPKIPDVKNPKILDIDNWSLFKNQLLKKIRDIGKSIK